MSVQQGGIESWQSSPSPVERGLFMLDVPGLKKAEKSVSLRASVFKQPKHIYLSLNSLGISTALAIGSVIRPGLP